MDNAAPKAIQAQAQGFIAFITYGVGMVIGANLSGEVVQHFTSTVEAGAVVEQVIQWQKIWLTPALIAGFILILFAALFKDEANS